MELMSSESTSADILAAALKTSFAPLIGFQRDIQRLTQGIAEFRQDLKASLGQTSQILNEGLKVSSEVISNLRDVLKEGGKLTLDFDRIMTDIKIDRNYTAAQTATVQERINNLAQSTGRTNGEIAQIIKANLDKMGDGFLEAVRGESVLEKMASNAARAATAYSFEPTDLGNLVSTAVGRSNVKGADQLLVPLILAQTAQDANITPKQLQSGLPRFQDSVQGVGLTGINSLVEYGSLAVTAKGYASDWTNRNVLITSFIEKLKAGRLQDNRSIAAIMAEAARKGESPAQAALAALAAENGGGQASLAKIFGQGTRDQFFAEYLIKNRENFAESAFSLQRDSGKRVNDAYSLRRNSASGGADEAGRSGDRLALSLTQGLVPAIEQATRALTDWTNDLSGKARSNPELTTALVGTGLAGLAAIYGGYKAKQGADTVRGWFGKGTKEGGALSLDSLLSGKLTNPLPVYVVNLPGMGFEGRGLTPVLDAFGPNRKGAAKPPGGGAVSAGVLGDVMGETRAPLSPARRGLGGLLGRVFRPLGMIDDAVSVVSAAQRGDAAGVGRGVGSGLGGMGGAMLGASLGSVVPIFGTLLGGLAGGVLGSMGGGSLLEGLMGRGGRSAVEPLPPLTPRTPPLDTKADHPADDLRRLTIDLNITGLPSGATADARSQWDKFNEAAYCGVTIRNTRSLVRI
ncbi:hypothetical protein [Elstera sp.]|jgi:predicted DNA-binding protein|uniref:hypothetical protein n=1 Tax=Elstera sp. TaxID=1916664 RepID=UPI0037C187DA